MTLFARLCLGDYFIHGIGGGAYDEVNDTIIRNYFGVDPPLYQVLSATLHLPLPTFPGTEYDVHDLAHRERRLYWNPQFAIPASEATRTGVADLILAHSDLAANEPSNRECRRKRYREFRRIGNRLRPLVEPQLAELSRKRSQLQLEVAANSILRRRDYAWVLYPEIELRQFLQSFL